MRTKLGARTRWMALALIGAAAGCSGGSEGEDNRMAVPTAQAAMNEADLAADAALAGDAAAAEAADAAAGGVNAGAEPNLQ